MLAQSIARSHNSNAMPVLQKYLGVIVHILEFKSNPIEFWSTDRLGQMLSIVALNRGKD